jgi:Raf kinase inhibitor-like YbhB/YbcL family protein
MGYAAGMKSRRLLLACLLAVACSQQSNAGSTPVVLAVDRPETQSTGAFTLTSADFRANGELPDRFSAYDVNSSPSLVWSGLPAGTKSLALLLEDPDASSGKPFVHWLVANIDPGAGGLSEGSVTLGARVGRNTRGDPAYFGPKPGGHDPHHYHFEMFALDRQLEFKVPPSRDQLLAAMSGHVLAKADLVGLYTHH